MLELIRKYRTPLLVVCLVMTALLIYSSRLRKQPETTLFEKAILFLASPLQRGFDTSTDTISSLWQHYLWLIDTSRENDRLFDENRWLRNKLDQVSEIRLENQRLSALLALREQLDMPTLPARVIAEDATSLFQTVIIDRGLEDGLHEGLPVMVPEGVVGRIIRCSGRQSRVLLATDASSAMAVLVQRSRARGICRGRGQSLTLDFALTKEDIVTGDRIITSGNGGIFPKGLAVGTVSLIQTNELDLFQSVVVSPAVNFSRLEEVLVLLENSP
ncbi:MAG: rod shape-determining protein MreC [Pedobacter sp.]